MMYSLISACRACNNPIENNSNVLSMRSMPMVGKLYLEKLNAKTKPVLPLDWVKCESCGLFQVMQDVPDSDIYTEYNYASSSFSGLQSHFDELSSKIDSFLKKRGSRKFLEIGCNDGILIKRVNNATTKVGVDPSDIARKAADESYTLLSEFFPTKHTRFDEHEFDVITTSNSFAHFSDISAAIREINRILAPDGTVIVEVHDGDLLLEQLQWDTIYHEHKVEWTVQAAQTCFAKEELYLTNVTRLPMHGGTIRLEFSKSAHHSMDVVSDKINEDKFNFFQDYYNKRFDTVVFKHLSNVDKFCCYGASGRAVCWLYQMGLSDKVACIYDDSHERIGRYVGHSGIEIRNGDNLGEYEIPVLITAWNFAENIKTRHKDRNIDWIQYYE